MTPRSCAYIISGVVLAVSNTKSKRLYSAHVVSMRSMRARCMPTQFLGPVLKGRNANFMASVGSAHRSGRKASGSGKTDGSRCVVYARLQTRVPGGT